MVSESAQNSKLIKVLEPQTVKPSLPRDFETSFPTSPLILSSLVVFDNSYSRVYSDDSVIDAAFSDKMGAVLKKNELGFTMPLCNSLALKEEFESVDVTGYIAFISGKKRVELYSGYDCVKFAGYDKILKGEAQYLDGKVLEIEGSKVALREAKSGDAIFEGDLGIDIATGGVVAGEVVVVLPNGYVMGYNSQMKAFTMTIVFPVAFSTLKYSQGKFYGLERDTNKFFVIGDGSSMLMGYTNCRLSKNSPYAICSDDLVGENVIQKNVPTSSDFSFGMGFLAELGDEKLNIYSLQRSFTRSIIFDYEMPAACIASDGNLYFTSFSELSYKIQDGAEKVVAKLPEGCVRENVKLVSGKFYCGGVFCGNFSEKIKENNEKKMFRRVEGEKIFYYFE